MTVRRHAARLATVCALLGGLVALGASPALADDSVRVRSADSFTAGGSAEGVSMEVRKRSDGCVLLRTALGLRLSGLRADQVRVQVAYDGRWWPVPVGGGGGSVVTGTTSPTNPRLCKGKSITVRYRVAFTASAPNGRLTVTGEASGALGQVLGRGAAESRVGGGRVSASPSPSRKPTPTPSVAATVAATEEGATLAALADPAGGATTPAAEESSGLSSVVMFFGLAMVAVGALLIVLLVRRSRADREPADDLAGLPLPANPGGTTYRSARGPAAVPGGLGQVYGQQPPVPTPPATPGVYGGSPAPRPSGGVYGTHPGGSPEATQMMPSVPTAPGRPGAAPTSWPPVPGAAPTSAPPVPGAAPTSTPPASGAAPTSGPPVSGQHSAPPVSGQHRVAPNAPISGPPVSRQHSAPPVSGQHRVAPDGPTSAPPVSGQHRAAPDGPTSAPPVFGQHAAAPDAPPAGRPGTPPPPDGGDHTVFMPRLPD